MSHSSNNVVGTVSVTDITGTVSLPTGAASSTKQSDGTQKSQVVDGANATIGPAQTISGTNYLPVVQASSVTSGSAVVERSTQIAGSDGTNARTLLTDSTGRLNNVDTFSSKMRVDINTSATTIPFGGAFTTVYTYSGSGYLIGFSIEFNNADVIPRLQIDGETIFSGNNFSTLNGLSITTVTNDNRQIGAGIKTSGSNIDFSLKYPIKFNSSVTISAATSGGINRSCSSTFVYIEKVT